MAMMTCKKCGSQIRAEDGVCPFCGAVYYVLSQDEGGTPQQSDRPQPRAVGDGWNAFSETPAAGEPALDASLGPEDDFDAWLASLSAGDGGGPAAPAQKTTGADPDITRVWSQPLVRQGLEDDDVKIWSSGGGDTTRIPVAQTQRAYAAERQAQRRYDTGTQPGPTASRGQAQTASRRQGAQQYAGRTRTEGRDYGDRRNPPPPPDRRSGGSGKRKFIALGAAVLAVLVVIICTLSGAFDFKKGNDQGAMPNLLGKNVEAAVAQLENFHVSVQLQYQENEAAEGTVILQDPMEGTALKRGDVVTLTVSGQGTGDPDLVTGTVILPTVVDMSYEAAARELEAMGLKVSRSGDVYSDLVKAGNVAGQSPEAGAKVEEGSTVILSVSQGPTPPTTWAITVTVGSGGSVTPKGRVEVEDGKSATFTIKPDEGFEIREVKVDGEDIGPVESYTFTDVTGDHTLYVVFQEKVPETPSPSPSDGGGTGGNEGATPGDTSPQEPGAGT